MSAPEGTSMRCSVCNTENPDDSASCHRCGTTPTPGTRRKSGRRRSAVEEVDSPFSPYIDPSNRAAARAWCLCMYGLIPGLGLVFGPLAVVFGAVAHRRGKADPGFTGGHFATAAIILGGLLSVTTWLGLALIVIALR
jgi:hypothetical protein